MKERLMARFVDANIFLRHLLNDHPTHSPAALALFRTIEQGNIRGWTTALVISEIVFVLSGRYYQISRDEIRQVLLPLINLRGLQIERKRMYRRVFDLYTTKAIDYNDCYHAALIESRNEKDLYSFDTDFDRIPGLQRVEPEYPQSLAEVD